MFRSMKVAAVLLASLSLTGSLWAGDDELQRERKNEKSTRPGMAKRAVAQNAAKDALEGHAPPPLTVEGWINSEGLTWADLHGKVVVIDFWGTW